LHSRPTPTTQPKLDNRHESQSDFSALALKLAANNHTKKPKGSPSNHWLQRRAAAEQQKLQLQNLWTLLSQTPQSWTLILLPTALIKMPTTNQPYCQRSVPLQDLSSPRELSNVRLSGRVVNANFEDFKKDAGLTRRRVEATFLSSEERKIISIFRRAARPIKHFFQNT
jgi:hypothetical protein